MGLATRLRLDVVFGNRTYEGGCKMWREGTKKQEEVGAANRQRVGVRTTFL